MNASYKSLVAAVCLLVICCAATPTVNHRAMSGGGSHVVAIASAVPSASDTGSSAVVDGAATQSRCSSSTLLNYIKDALYFYNGTDNALGISQRISDNVLGNEDGAWIVDVTQVIGTGSKKTQWAYWGSTNIYSSGHWCHYANEQWLVQIGKIAL